MTKTTRTTPTTKALLTDIGFVLAMTQKVKESMGNRPTPPAAAVPARVAARKQLVVAA